MRKFLLITALLILSPLLLYIAYVATFSAAWRMMGYEIGLAPWRLAEKLVSEHRPAQDCLLYRTVDMFPGPTTAAQQAGCIYEYAKLAKDPSACELLLPSEYGWSCLGVARAHGEACSINYGQDVSWWEESVDEVPKTATMGECRQGILASRKGQDCCYILRLTSENGLDDCSRFRANPPFSDLCASQLAMKTGNADICNDIDDGNARAICELRLRYADRAQ